MAVGPVAAGSTVTEGSCLDHGAAWMWIRPCLCPGQASMAACLISVPCQGIAALIDSDLPGPGRYDTNRLSPCAQLAASARGR